MNARANTSGWVRAAKFGCIALLLMIAMIAAGLTFLSSAAGGKFLVGQLRRQLSRHGVAVTFARADFDLWHLLDLEDVHVESAAAGNSFRADIARIVVRYRIEWIKRRLTISTLEIERPRLVGQINLSAPNSPSPEPDAPTGFSLNNINLPFGVRLQSFKAGPIDADARAPGIFGLYVHGADFRGGMAMEKDGLEGSAHFDLGRDGHFSYGERVTFDFAGQGDVDARWASGALSVKPSHLAIQLDKLTTASKGWSVRRIELMAHAEAAARVDGSLRVKFHELRAPPAASRGRPVEAGFELTVTGSPTFSPLDLTYRGHFENETPLEGRAHFKRRSISEKSKEGAAEARVDLNLMLTPVLAHWLSPSVLVRQNRGGKADLQIELVPSTAGPGQSALDDFSAAKFGLHVPQIKVAGQENWASAVVGQLRWGPEFKSVDLESEAEFDLGHVGKWRLNPKWRFEQNFAKTNGQTHLASLRAPKNFRVEGEYLLEHTVTSLENQPLDAQLDLHFPALKIAGWGEASAGEAYVELKRAKTRGQDLDFRADVRQGPLRPLNHDPISGLRLNVRGELKNGEDLRVPKISVRVDGDHLSFEGEVTANLRRRDLQTKSRLDLRLPKPLSLPGGSALEGDLAAPFQISVLGGKEFTLDGGFDFDHLGFKHGDVSFKDLNGRVPLKERLKWDGAKLRFTEVLNENPFERVDFNRVRPLLHGTEQLRIEKITWRDRRYGPFVGFVSLRQNLISLHQFDLDLLAGKAAGEAFLNLQPANLQAGFLGRLTGLNLTEFLPESFLGRLDRRTRDLSARAGVIFNLNRASLEGRVDVTEIGGRQLISMINVLDPGARDEKMNKLRSVLQIGYPSAVRAGLAEGFMDLDVDVSLLGVTSRQQIHAIPLSGLIGKYTRTWVIAAAKGILK